MSKKRRRNGQFAPDQSGRKAPTAALKVPGHPGPRTASEQALSFACEQLGVSSADVTFDAAKGVVTVGGEVLVVKVQPMVPTDFGRAKGAKNSTVFTLRRPGWFQKDLSEVQVAEIREGLAGQ